MTQRGILCVPISITVINNHCPVANNLSELICFLLAFPFLTNWHLSSRNPMIFAHENLVLDIFWHYSFEILKWLQHSILVEFLLNSKWIKHWLAQTNVQLTSSELFLFVIPFVINSVNSLVVFQRGLNVFQIGLNLVMSQQNPMNF